MPHQRLEQALAAHLTSLDEAGTLKGRETVITGLVPPSGEKGPRYTLAGQGDRPFLRMNSNGYLGMARRPEVIAAEEEATRVFGAGPGAVRFISGTWAPHVELERRLAGFHGREDAMIFSSAYATLIGILPPLITDRTAVVSDELNHNCIINAIRLSRPAERHVYGHLDMADLVRCLGEAAGSCDRAIVVSDGVFSMRGDYAPLPEIMEVARRFDDAFAEGVVVVIDDSHGVGAFGGRGRGTEDHTESAPADLLVATLGKSFGVNGGYVAASATVIRYLRETAPCYVYSNPITQGEAAAAAKALEILDGAEGRALLEHLGAMTARFEGGLGKLGLETIPGPHPIVPLMVRDTTKTAAIVDHLWSNGILATGLNYPVVPRGEQAIRFQLSADHTPADVDEVLAVLADRP